ncbi:MAG TPA: NUDIX domain-containing protein [Chitinophagaceae bacterium]|nr:NUDIX domain-containing protein [Chitinophagaceae bacterium]
MTKYQKQTRLLAAVDCIIFGFDRQSLKILLIQRGFEPEKGKWSLMGGFIQPDESSDEAATRILKSLTGLEGVYLEQLHTFGAPLRDPIERTLSIAYFALIDIHKYEKILTDEYHPEWFPLNKIPNLIFDHKDMVKMAKEKLRYKAALHPILFELLPKKFTIPHLQHLYESTYEAKFDKRNFSRKVLSTKLLVKQTDKDRMGSKKGAFYYKLNTRNYKANFQAFLNIIPNSHLL